MPIDDEVFCQRTESTDTSTLRIAELAIDEESKRTSIVADGNVIPLVHVVTDPCIGIGSVIT